MRALSYPHKALKKHYFTKKKRLTHLFGNRNVQEKLILVSFLENSDLTAVRKGKQN